MISKNIRAIINCIQPKLEDQRGAVSVLTVSLIPVLFILAGVALDFSSLNSQRKHVQSQADLSALSGILNLEDANAVRESAREAARTNDFYVAHELRDDQVRLGRIDDSTNRFVANADQTTLENVSAVAVKVESKANFNVLGHWVGINNASVTRAATAEAMPEVSFALSNCLLSMNLFHGALTPLLGANAGVLCSGVGLRMDMIELLDEIALSGSVLTPANPSYSDVLDAEIEYSDLLEMVFNTAVPTTLGTIQLSEIFQVSDKLRQVKVGSPIPAIEFNAADLVFGGLEVLGENVVNLETEIDLGPFADVVAKLMITEPRKVIIGARPGDPNAVAQTSQIRLEVNDLNIGGIFNMSLAVNLANATATLSIDGEHCSGSPLLRAAVFDPVEATLLDLDLKIEVLDIPVLSVVDPVRNSSLFDSTVQSVSFTHEEVQAKEAKIFGPQSNADANAINQNIRDLTGTMLTSVRDAVDADAANCSGLLGCLIEPILNSISANVTSVIGDVINAFSTDGELVNAILEDFLGIGIAQAELEVLDVNCNYRLAA